MDNPEFQCFAECDEYWGWCAWGDLGCVQVWLSEGPACITDPYYFKCCVIAIHGGLF